MSHWNQDEFLAEAIGEASPREHAHRMAHLEQCPECAAEFDALRQDLAAAASLVDGNLRERDAAWADDLWQRLRPQLEPYSPRRGLRFSGLLWPRLAWVSGLAALLAVSFLAGRVWEQRQRPQLAMQLPPPPPQVVRVPAPAATPAPVPAPRPVVVVLLADHLDRSERLLVQLKHAELATDETAPALRQEARSLLEENRQARQRAEAKGDPALRGTLDQLHALLDQMANHPDGLTPADLVRLRDQMNAAGLLFEVRVLRSRIPRGEGAAPSHSYGDVI
jgi:hypothetical protein